MQNCTTCQRGYSRYNMFFVTECRRCLEPGCQYCTSNYTECTSCYLGYRYNLGSCQKCISPFCNYCSSNILQCSICKRGYTVTPTGLCVPCEDYIPKCEYCSTGNSTNKTYYDCIIDTIGFGRYNNSCDVACMATNCKFCNSTAATCTDCLEGYTYVYPNCVPCNDFIPGCTKCTEKPVYDSNLQCFEC